MELALLFILLILIISWVCWTERCFLLQVFCITSVIKPKGESQNGCFEKTKHVKFSEKRRFLKESSFFGKFEVLCFLSNTNFEIRPIALLPTITYCSLQLTTTTSGYSNMLWPAAGLKSLENPQKNVRAKSAFGKSPCLPNKLPYKLPLGIHRNF